MLVAKELRERLSNFCLVTKQTQEQAANGALLEMLDRADSDPVMRQRLDRAKALQQELETLRQELGNIGKGATA